MARKHKKHPLPTLFTVALLWPAASLPCWPSHIREPYVLTKRRIRAVYCILYAAVIFALLKMNNCLWLEERRRCFYNNFQRKSSIEIDYYLDPGPGCSAGPGSGTGRRRFKKVFNHFISMQKIACILYTSHGAASERLYLVSSIVVLHFMFQCIWK